ncbi:MAG: hypothetical protein GF398_21425 [Chitinivibrionales bacterium]|nr:hypothetical protein [Chitinivibrionales bacterium]
MTVSESVYVVVVNPFKVNVKDSTQIGDTLEASLAGKTQPHALSAGWVLDGQTMSGNAFAQPLTISSDTPIDELSFSETTDK